MDHSNRNLAFHPKSAAPAAPDEAHVPMAGSAADPAPAIRIEEILDVLRRGERFLVCSHTRPDGDAVGSMLAMGMFLVHEINPLRLDYINRIAALSGKTVLDVGCGGGILSESMAAAGATVT